VIEMTDIGSLLEAACALQDLAQHRQNYLDQDEFVVVENFLPAEVLAHWNRQLEQLKPHIHRNFIPRHKKGGSVAYSSVCRFAPMITAVYHHPSFMEFLRRIVEAHLIECPESDQHRCALYSYTEAGDHIGWHYDTSYYKDRRWTVLAGLQDHCSSKLLCHLHTRNKNREIVKLELRVEPGTLVIFNGDKVWHSVTPTQARESRYIISMQYVTSTAMNPFMRFVSNMKDAIAYFGFKGVFARPTRSALERTTLSPRTNR
jgi:2-oxoglutarate-Fe(II)-dependent oxygenase superfamily protein